MPKDRPRESFIMNHTDNEGSEPTTEEVRRLEAALLALDRPAVWALLRSAEGNPVSVTRLERLMVPALENIGRSWEAGGVALSQVYMSGRLCEEVLNAAFDPASRPPLNHPAMAMAVLEDNHALGKTMVCSMLRACGYTLNEYELGIGVQALIQRVVRDDIKILLISTLMLRSALQVKQVTAALEKARPETRVLVGGAPFLFDADLWREVGAHAMGRNASDAVRIIQPWCVPPAGTP